MPKHSTIIHKLAIAKAVSEQSDFNHYHLGCIVCYKGTIIANGYNNTKTSPVQKKYNKHRGYDVEAGYNSIHAELMALAKIKYLDIDFSKVVFYIYREHANGRAALARPCAACRAAIKDMGIKTIYYTTEDGYCMERFE